MLINHFLWSNVIQAKMNQTKLIYLVQFRQNTSILFDLFLFIFDNKVIYIYTLFFGTKRATVQQKRKKNTEKQVDILTYASPRDIVKNNFAKIPLSSP